MPSAGLRRLRTIFLVVAVLGALGDLASKSLAFSRLGSPPGKVEVIPGILRFECAWNPGVAWGMFSERSMRSAILALSVVAVPVIFFFFWRQKSPAWPNAVGLAGIAAGTLGNLHDRIRWGAVRDFIYVYCINFPVFNVADSMICVGAALFALEHVLVGRKKDEPVGVPEKAS